ncbi:MAG: riboflavin biosynthesis protein RibF [Bacteroidia bacterium]|nr:riboflavin biosynthesis protein RibF [Bacteroidia bacterium]
MRIFTDINNFWADKPVLTIGTFDGVHKGHTKVLSCLKTIAEELGGESIVFTFLQHPRMVINKDDADLKLLSTFEEKAEQLEKYGIDILIAHPFSKEFSQMTSDEFIREYLVKKIRVHSLIVGYDHQFGKNREGEGRKLQEYSVRFGFNFHTIEALNIDEINVSSTKIRNALVNGNINQANQYLGYHYSISGTVIEGGKFGKQIGYPTANIHIDDPIKLIPANGVYAVRVVIDNMYYNGMLNIGFRPTIAANTTIPVIEVNIFDFNRDIYDRKIKIAFWAKLRNEIKFNSIDELTRQLELDKQRAQYLLPQNIGILCE